MGTVADIAHCLVAKKDSIIKVEEKRAKATFINKSNDLYCVYDNDKCVMGGHEKRADYVICHAQHGELIVELKGRGVEDAVKQIAATYEYWKNNNLFVGPRQAGLIVCKQVPHAASAQKAQEAFAQKYKRRLRVVTRCEQREFASVVT